MMKHLSFLLLVFSFLDIHSQNWQWSKPIMLEAGSRPYETLIALPDGRVVLCGSSQRHYDYLPSWAGGGSYFQLYDSTGTLLLSRTLGNKFFIQKLVHDGATSFYFVGFFSGTQLVDGFTITSEGRTDGMIGKMDMSGTLQWIHTMGADDDDGYMGLILNPADGHLYAGGAMTDELLFDGILQSSHEQSAVLAVYSVAGTLLQHHLYDGVPGREHFRNAIWEVADDKTGNLYVLMDKDGVSWTGDDSISGDDEGRYVFRLAADLSESWSEFIIGSGCYYGWSCHNLSVVTGGDPYVLSYCDWHHGGVGYITRLDALDGHVAWQITDPQAIYQAMHIEGTQVILAGREDYYYCPCPYGFPGYEVVKIIDASNNTIGQARMINANIRSMSGLPSGEIFFRSYFQSDSCMYGPDMLSPSPLPGYYYTNVLSKMNSLLCDTVIVNLQEAHYVSGYNYEICAGIPASIHPAAPAGTYLWNTGHTDSVLSVSSAGTYYCSNTQSSGCIAYSIPVSTQIEDHPLSYELEFIRYDKTAGMNGLYISRLVEYFNFSTAINLYKDSSGIISLVDSRPTGLLTSGSLSSSYVMYDSVLDPNQQTGTYFITTTGRCETESPADASHTSVLLQVDLWADSTKFLSWNAYGGSDVDYYTVLRGSSPSSLTPYADIYGLAFHDTAMGNYYYQVKPRLVTPTWHFIAYSYSNIVYSIPEDPVVVDGIYEDSFENLVSAYPNPSEGMVSLSTVALPPSSANEASVTVLDAYGKIIRRDAYPVNGSSFLYQADLRDQSPGIYFIEMQLGDRIAVKKIVLN